MDLHRFQNTDCSTALRDFVKTPVVLCYPRLVSLTTIHSQQKAQFLRQ